MAEAFGVAASALAVIELSAKVVKTCSQYTKDVANARRDIRRLRKEVQSFGAVAKSVQELSESTPRHKVTTLKKMQPILDEGRMHLAELHTKVDPGKREKFMSRVGLRAMRWPLSSKDVGKALADLARLMQAMSVAMSVDQTTLLLSLEQKNALAKLPIAEGAIYDSHADEHNPNCLENTRTEVLREIRGWVRSPSSRAVYWLNGMAGTGKSTISRTIADKSAKDDSRRVRLGATFFFKRGESDRGNMSRFFTTITSQLVRQLPEIAGHVQAAIEADPSLVSKSMRIQFETLIVDPVAKISSTERSGQILLFVIDALDECAREKDVQLLIELLSGIPRAMAVQLRFFLTSRPELPIRLGFHSINGRYRDFILHEVAESIIEHDLQVYLRHELERTRLAFNQGLPKERKLPPTWPNQRDIGSLVQMASPLFIFAATICRFVADRKGGSPEKKLRRVLEFRSAQAPKLVATYMPVLEQLTMDLAPEEQSEILLQFGQIVGPIVVLADPLGSRPLSRLLDVEINEILELLDFLHSILQVPSSTKQPIRLLHLSFRDFLVDPTREGNSFWINERKVHQQLAEDCLRVLNSSLKDDICNVKAPGTLASSVPASRIKRSIPQELQYACRFWTHHLRESSSTDLNTADIWKFLRSHFLHWLETLSWMGRLSESFGIITDLQSASLIEKDHEMSGFLKDSVRFLQAANSSIQIAPLQAYSSSLAFAPSESIVRRNYEGDMLDCIMLGTRMPPSWDDRLQTFEIHRDDIVRVTFLSDGKLLAAAFWDGTVILLSAATGERRMQLYGGSLLEPIGHTWAFSPDGKLLALAMKTEYTVTLWHIETGERQETFIVHEESVTRVIFSPDSKYLASVSRDGVVIIWAVNTGKRRQMFHTFENPLDPYSERACLAISPDNELLALSSVNHDIALWETKPGKPPKILRGHSNFIRSMKFSPNSKLLASASSDRTIILWNTKTAEQQRLLKAHTGEVETVTFSLKNDLLASASDNGTVILWQPKTGQQISSLEGHGSKKGTSIAFSPNGKLLASAYHGGNVLLWSAETGEWLRTFEGQMGFSNHISFSPDSKRLAATSGRGSISVWATDTIEGVQMLEKHPESVCMMRFSHDSKLLASASYNGTLMLWRSDTGEHKQTLEWHSSFISALTFSPDNQFLASGSGDGTVVIWMVDTGERWQTLVSHIYTVTTAVFSPDSKILATVAYDETVVLWATDTGVRWQTLKGHTEPIHSVVFSPDGEMLATASHDQTIALWVMSTGARWQTLEGHSKRIISIAFSPNSKMLASASDDQTVNLWATDTGERRGIFRGYFTAPRDIVFLCHRKLVALDSGRTMVLCAAEMDEGQQTPVKIGHNGSRVELDQSTPSNALVHRSSASAFPPGSNGTESLAPSISQDGCWVCLDGEPILWLPLEYRAHQSAVSGHTLAIGFAQGQAPQDDDTFTRDEAPKDSEKRSGKAKTMAELDEEMRAKMSGLSGDGGEAGIEYEDGKPVAMKRSVKNNMFRYI